MQKIYFVCVLLFSLAVFSQNKLDVFFDFNKDFPNEQSQLKINQWFLDNKSVEVTKVLGYCDSVDDSKYNRDLAMRRVNSMVEILNKNNIKIADKVALKSFGKDFKSSKNQSENRKVEVFYNIIIDKKPTEKEFASFKENSFETKDVSTLVEEEKSNLAIKFEKAKKGDLIRINNIVFYFNSEKVIEQSMPLLDELLEIMFDNPKLRIEIHGHICCNPNPMDTKLSYRRALVIFKYLTDNGITIGRLAYKGIGSNNPIYRLPERNEKERAANRRVEILIVNK
jgi:outer membrane protein OmpA-like peptidoglycan-associated protein